MRWVQWPSKTMQFYWYPSWAVCSQALSLQFTQGLNVDKASHSEVCIESTKRQMHTEYQTQQGHYSTMILWKGHAIKGKYKCNFKRRHVPACCKTVCAHMSTKTNYLTYAAFYVQLVQLIHVCCMGMQNFRRLEFVIQKAGNIWTNNNQQI